MRTLRILSLILCCYLAGWGTADLLVPIVLARREVTNDALRSAEMVQMEDSASLAQQP